MFFCVFCEIFNNNYLYRTPLVAACNFTCWFYPANIKATHKVVEKLITISSPCWTSTFKMSFMVKFSGNGVLYALSIFDLRANATFLAFILMLHFMLSSLLKECSTAKKLLNIILSLLVFPLCLTILSPK